MRDKRRAGALVSSLLAGSWRSSPPPLTMTPTDVEALVPLFLSSGAAPLAWWRIFHSRLPTQPFQKLRQAYRLSAIQSLVREHQIAEIMETLGSHGLVPLLGKGLAAARLYPEPGLRPYGDFDLYVPERQYEDVRARLQREKATLASIDLHRGFAEVDDRPSEELYRRSQSITIEGVKVFLFGPEDHLRLLCLHTLRHGVVRPLWLCDIAAALESLPEGFDWDYFFSGCSRRTEAVRCALLLAHTLFGVSLDGVPLVKSDHELPRWIISSVLHHWGTPYRPRIPTEYALRSPRVLLGEIGRKWPNPIEATMALRAGFTNVPRFPIQLIDCLVRTVRLLRRAVPMWLGRS